VATGCTIYNIYNKKISLHSYKIKLIEMREKYCNI